VNSQNQREKFRVEFASPVRLEKIGEVLEIEGIILSVGTFTDSQGKTFTYTRDILEKSKDTFVGVPIVFPHTLDFEGASNILNKVGGFSTQTWVDGDDLWYKGVVYKKPLIKQALAHQLQSHSIEAGIEAVYDSNLGTNKVLELTGEAIALTDKPACATCQAKSMKVKSNIKLEEREGDTPPSPSEPPESETCSGELFPEREVYLVKNLCTGTQVSKTRQKGERVRIAMDEEESDVEPKTAEDVLQEITRLAENYPGPEKPWEEMSKAEKTRACKTIGFTKVEKTQAEEPTEMAAPSMAAFAFAMKAAGIPKEKIEEALKKLKEKYPYPAPEKTKKEDIDVEALFEESPEVTAMREEKEGIERELNTMKEAKAVQELTTIVEDIRKMDPTFDDKIFFEGTKCTHEKIALSKKYKVQLERMKKPASVQQVSDIEVSKIDRISMETFGDTPEGLLRTLVPEAFKEEEK